MMVPQMVQRPESAGRERKSRWRYRSLRLCSPPFLLVLVTLLAGIVVLQEVTMRSATHTETYYRKALLTIGDRRGQTVAAGFEEFTSHTAAGQQPRVGDLLKHTVGDAAAEAGGLAQHQPADTQGRGGQHAALDAGTRNEGILHPGGALQLPEAGVREIERGMEVQQQQQQELQEQQQQQQQQRQQQEETQQQQGISNGAQLDEQGQAGGLGLAAGQDPQRQATEQHNRDAAAEQEQVGIVSERPVGRAAIEQQSSTDAGEAVQQAGDTAVAAAAAAQDQSVTAGGAVEQQQDAVAEVTSAEQLAAQQAAATAAEQAILATATELQQQEAVHEVAAQQQQQQQQQQDTAALAATALAAEQQASASGASNAAEALAQQQATAAAAAAEVAAAAAGAAAGGAAATGASDEVQPAGPLEDEWWTELGEPRRKLVPQAHSTTARLVHQEGLGPKAQVLGAALPAQLDSTASGSDAGAGSCKIYVLDAAQEFGPLMGAPTCDVDSPFIWPFASPGKGIDGAETLRHQDSQYAAGYWITQAIRDSGAETADLAQADFVYVDMHCYHTWWLSWHHPLGSQGMADPTRYIQRSYELMQDMPRFLDSRGADFGLVQPGPSLRGLYSEAGLCEDLSSVLHLVPERSSLCVWTRDNAERGKAVIVPYVATTDLAPGLPEALAQYNSRRGQREGGGGSTADAAAAAVAAAAAAAAAADAQRDLLLFFRGGCGNPDPSVRQLFAAGKMLRYWLVERLQQGGAPDVEAVCSCDICTNREPHAQLLAKMRRSVFCPVVASNVQSSRRLSEAVLSGCIPVFIGPPFHTLPLARHVDYASMALFLDIEDTGLWINRSSMHWEHNHMVSKAWKLDAPINGAMVSLPSLDAVLPYLRSLPAEVVRRKQQALRAQAPKLYYPPLPAAEGAEGGGARSALGEILVGEMCRRAATVRARRAAAEQDSVATQR